MCVHYYSYVASEAATQTDRQTDRPPTCGGTCRLDDGRALCGCRVHDDVPARGTGGRSPPSLICAFYTSPHQHDSCRLSVAITNDTSTTLSTSLHCGKTAHSIEVLIGVVVPVGPTNNVLHGVQIPRLGKGAIFRKENEVAQCNVCRQNVALWCGLELAYIGLRFREFFISKLPFERLVT